MLKIIPKRKFFLSIAGFLVAAAIVVLLIPGWGLKLGIDFTGGSLMEVTFLEERPSNEEVREALANLNLGEATLQPFGDRGVIIRSKFLTEGQHQEVLNSLREKFADTDESGEAINSPASAEATAGKEAAEEETGSGGVEIVGSGVDIVGVPDGLTVSNVEVAGDKKDTIREERFESIGPSIGQELKEKSIYALIGALICIVLYIAWAFRKVSKPVTSWKYGVIAIITLAHDILIVVGIFVVLGRFLHVEIGVSFIAALLTVLGYSVNDTIVVFDRIRENLPRSDDNFNSTVNNSVNQTIIRSINTSLTTLIVLLAIFFFGGETVKFFVLALILGVLAGTYSSIFIASPLLVVWHKLAKK